MHCTSSEKEKRERVSRHAYGGRAVRLRLLAYAIGADRSYLQPGRSAECGGDCARHWLEVSQNFRKCIHRLLEARSVQDSLVIGKLDVRAPLDTMFGSWIAPDS